MQRKLMLALVMISAATVDAASYQKTDGTIVDPIEYGYLMDYADHPYAGVDLEPSAALSGVDLSYANLDSADLQNSDLSYANLYMVDFYTANLSVATLVGANLDTARLFGADVSGANLEGANLSNAELVYTDFSGANLTNADFTGVDLAGVNLTGADLAEANLTDADLTNANLTNANLQGAQLNGIELTGADLSGAKLSGLDNFLLNKIGSLKTEVGTHTHDGDNSGISPEQAAAIQANTAKVGITAEQAEAIQEQSEALKEGLTELEDQEDRIFLLEAQLATLQTMVAQLSDTATIQGLEQQVADLSERPTLQQVRDGRPGSVLLNVDSEAGSVVLDFTVEESEDLITWTPVEESGVSKTLTLPEGKRFYRFAH